MSLKKFSVHTTLLSLALIWGCSNPVGTSVDELYVSDDNNEPQIILAKAKGGSIRMELETFSSFSGYSSMSTGTKGVSSSQFSGGKGKYAGGSGLRACKAVFKGTSQTYNIRFRWYDKKVSVKKGNYRVVIQKSGLTRSDVSWSGNASKTGWYDRVINNVQLEKGDTVKVFASREKSADPCIMDYIDFIPVNSADFYAMDTSVIISDTIVTDTIVTDTIVTDTIFRDFNRRDTVDVIQGDTAALPTPTPDSVSFFFNPDSVSTYKGDSKNISIQAEDTLCISSSGTTIDNNNKGYTGRGFVNVANKVGTWTQCSVVVPSAGTYQVIVRYANGSSAREAMLNVNGRNVMTGAFSSTGSWTQWNNYSFSRIALKAGMNTIRFTALTSGGLANIDRYNLIRN